jgi:hypothetical protein
MTGLRPGDVVTDEPAIVGTIVTAPGAPVPGSTATLRADLRWEYSYCLAEGACTGHSWAEVTHPAGSATVRRVPAPVPAETRPGAEAAAELEDQADHLDARSADTGSAALASAVPSPLHRAARAVLVVADAARTVGAEVPDLAWTVSGDLAGRPVLTVTVVSLDAGWRLAGVLGFTETPGPGGDTRLWEGTIRGVGAAITAGVAR